MENIIKKEINVKGILIECVQTSDEKIWVVLPSLCNGLGIVASGQVERIKRDKDLLLKGASKILVPTNGGNQETNCLQLEFLPYFLTGIKASMCKEEIRDNIVEFKLKAKDILAEAFLGENNEKTEQFFDSLGLKADIKEIVNEAIQEATKPLNDKINIQNDKLDKQGKVIYLNNNKISELQVQIKNVEDNITFKQNINPRYLFEYYTAQYFAGQNKAMYVRGFYDDLSNWTGIDIPHANELPDKIKVRDYILSIIDIKEIEFFVKGVLGNRIVKSENGNFVDLQGIFSNNIEIEKLKREFGYRCAYCGSTQDLNIEHLMPQRKCSQETPEITDLYENVIINCQHCNELRKDMTPLKKWYSKQSFFSEDKYSKIVDHWDKYRINENDRTKLHNEILSKINKIG